MLIRSLISLCLGMLLGSCASSKNEIAETPNFFLYRMGEKKKPEAAPFYSAKVSEKQYKVFLHTGEIFGVTDGGCYVAVYAPTNGRTPASERIVPAKTTRRVCKK
jgi:hypothetical protein